jgi:hypothetical protein
MTAVAAHQVGRVPPRATVVNLALAALGLDMSVDPIHDPLVCARPESACSGSGFYGVEDVHVGPPDAIGFAAEDAEGLPPDFNA